jgi:tetratricopeptide (TPR) repeat protein
VWFAYGKVPGTGAVSFFPDYFNQGNKYYTLGQLPLATAEYEKALFVRPGRDPRVPLLAAALADLYVKLGNRARAEAMLREVIATGAGTPNLSRKLASLANERR